MLREQIITEGFAGYTVKIVTRRDDVSQAQKYLVILPEHKEKRLSREEWLKLSAFVDAHFVREED